ncbi:MAG: AAA family ATPase, partial [Candidatus Paceibacterota bacterium]
LGGIFAGGKCYQYEFRTPYKVFAEAIDAYIEKVKRLTKQEQEALTKHILDSVGELGGEVVKIAPSIVDLIGQPPKLEELEAEKEKIRFLMTITNFMASLSVSQVPLLMFLDDLQWVDDGSLEILERLAGKLKSTSSLIIISYRDTDVDENHPLIQSIKKLSAENINFLQLPVKSFSINDTAQIICQILLDKQERVLPLANELQGRAKGNPYFTLELLHSLVDANVVFLKDDHYTYDLDKLKSTNLPVTIVDAVLKRMKDLSEEHLEIISYASIMGKEIEFKLLTELTGKPAEKIVTSLEEGIKNQLLFRDLTGQENIFFMHDRIREAFYQRVPKEERVPLHRHIAEVVETQSKDNVDPVLYDLAHHFTEGQVEDKALYYSIKAGKKAKESYANTLAINLFTTSRDILEKQGKTGSAEHIEVLEDLGESNRFAGRFDDSVQILKQCESLIPRQDIIHRAQVMGKIGDALFEKASVEESAKVLEQALYILGIRLPRSKLAVFMLMPVEFSIQMLHTIFPGIFIRKTYRDDHLDIVRSRIWRRLMYTYYFSDTIRMFVLYLKCQNFTERRIGPSKELLEIYINSPAIYSTIILPWLSRGLRYGEKALKMAQEFNNKILEGVASAYLCLGYFLANKPDKSMLHGQKSISILRGAGEYWELAVGYHFVNHFDYYITGKLKEAVSGDDDFISMMRASKGLQGLGWALEGSAKVSTALGDVSEATEARLLESIDLMERARDKMIQVYAIAALGFIYSRRGECDKAIKEIQRAMKSMLRYYLGCWHLDIFCLGADIYLTKLATDPKLAPREKKRYRRNAFLFCLMSTFWGILYNVYRGHALQVN